MRTKLDNCELVRTNDNETGTSEGWLYAPTRDSLKRWVIILLKSRLKSFTNDPDAIRAIQVKIDKVENWL